MERDVSTDVGLFALILHYRHPLSAYIMILLDKYISVMQHQLPT